jgi:hypothetical protein
MTPAELLSQVHDAVLRSVHLDWAQGIARLELALARPGSDVPRTATLLVDGVRRLHCPREEPWGWSTSVNGGRLLPAGGDYSRLELEMQSGDTLLVEGRTFAVAGVDAVSPGEG